MADVDAALTIVFPIYPDLTQLDFTGPHQVLARLPGAKAITASVAGGEVVAEDGLRFLTTRLGEVERADVLCVPGGLACTEAIEDEAYMGHIRRLAEGARYVTSVCTGSLILAAAGLLRGRRAACHWGWREHLAMFGAIPDPGRVVRDGRYVTGGGVTAGIDFALTLAGELTGEAGGQMLELAFEYAPQPPFGTGRPELAPAPVLAMVQARMQGAGEREAALVRAAERLRATA